MSETAGEDAAEIAADTGQSLDVTQVEGGNATADSPVQATNAEDSIPHSGVENSGSIVQPTPQEPDLQSSEVQPGDADTLTTNHEKNATGSKEAVNSKDATDAKDTTGLGDDFFAQMDPETAFKGSSKMRMSPVFKPTDFAIAPVVPPSPKKNATLKPKGAKPKSAVKATPSSSKSNTKPDLNLDAWNDDTAFKGGSKLRMSPVFGKDVEIPRPLTPPNPESPKAQKPKARKPELKPALELPARKIPVSDEAEEFHTKDLREDKSRTSTSVIPGNSRPIQSTTSEAIGHAKSGNGIRVVVEVNLCQCMQQLHQ